MILEIENLVFFLIFIYISAANKDRGDLIRRVAQELLRPRRRLKICIVPPNSILVVVSFDINSLSIYFCSSLSHCYTAYQHPFPRPHDEHNIHNFKTHKKLTSTNITIHNPPFTLLPIRMPFLSMIHRMRFISPLSSDLLTEVDTIKLLVHINEIPIDVDELIPKEKFFFRFPNSSTTLPRRYRLKLRSSKVQELKMLCLLVFGFSRQIIMWIIVNNEWNTMCKCTEWAEYPTNNCDHLIISNGCRADRVFFRRNKDCVLLFIIRISLLYWYRK